MKIKYIAPAAAAAILATAITINEAESNAATDLGTSVAKSIVGAIAGKGANELIGLIFGTQQNTVTIDQIKNAIDDAFATAALNDLQGQFNGIRNQISDYRPSASTALDDSGAIVTATGILQGDIEAHINKGNSVKTIPLHVSITNSRLAFAAERYRLEKIPDNRAAIATAALSGLHSLQHYLEGEMWDPKRKDWPCVKKDSGTVLNSNGIDGSNWSTKGIDISTQYCYSNGWPIRQSRFQKQFMGKGLTEKMVVQSVMLTPVTTHEIVNTKDAYYMLNTDLGRSSNSGIYMFARRMDNRGSEYFLEATKSKQYAEMLRNHYFLKYYPRELGDLHAQVLAWIDIVKATGNGADISEAMNLGVNLGIGWNTLKDRYNHQGISNYINQNLVPFFAHQGEKRAILD